jgi:hypothetical protein
MVQSLGLLAARPSGCPRSAESLPAPDFIRFRWVMLGRSCQAMAMAQIIMAVPGWTLPRWHKCGIAFPLGVSRLSQAASDKVHCSRAGIMV